MAKTIKEEIMGLMAPGSTFASEDQDDKISDPELLKTVGSLVAGGASATKIAEALDSPSSVIAATMRRNRRKIAMVLYHLTADRMAELTQDNFEVTKLALAEISRRMNDPEILASMKTEDLIKLMGAMNKWIMPISQSVLMPNLGLDSTPKKSDIPLTQSTVNILIGQIHEHKTKAERELEDVRDVHVDRSLESAEDAEVIDALEPIEFTEGDPEEEAREHVESELATDRSSMPSLRDGVEGSARLGSRLPPEPKPPAPPVSDPQCEHSASS